MLPDSPGVVVFDHSSHVDLDAPECASCHTNDFAILHDGTVESASMLMESMEAGHSCGRCHDGETAFSVEDDCDYCHRED